MKKEYYRRIEFERYEEDPLPSKRTLFSCYFADNFGKKYKWSPKWRDVEELFIKAYKIEKNNYPEMEWDSEFIKVLEKSPTRPHDKEIFKKSDKIMREEEIKDLFDLVLDAVYYSKEEYQLFNYLNFFEFESNKYISKILYDSAENMIAELKKLSWFMSESQLFWAVPHNKRGKYIFFPDEKEFMERNCVVGRKDYEEQYRKNYFKLKKLVEDARSAYEIYRTEVRDILFL